MPQAEAFPRWKDAATQAVRLGTNLAEAHSSLAGVLFYRDANFRGAESEYLTAIRLNPSFADAHAWYSDLLIVTGRVDQAIFEAKRAQQLDPYSDVVNDKLSVHLYLARRNDELVVQAQRILDVNAAHYWMGLAYEQKGDYDKAISLLQPPNLKEAALADLSHAYAAAGRKEEALREIAKMKVIAKGSPVNPFAFAIAYAGVAEHDEALKWLERTIDQSLHRVTQYVKLDPRLDPLRSDPRYKS